MKRNERRRREEGGGRWEGFPGGVPRAEMWSYLEVLRQGAGQRGKGAEGVRAQVEEQGGGSRV